MFDCNDQSTSENDESLPPSPIYDRYQSRDGYHAVSPPYTGTFMPPKPDLVFHNAPNVDETVQIAFNVERSPTKPDKDLSPTHSPLAPIIEDWVSDLEDDYETKIPQNAPSFVQPNEHVKPPRSSVKSIETSIPAANPKTAILKPKSQGNNRNRKACFVCKSLTYLIKDLLTKFKLVPITTTGSVTAAAPKPLVTRPRQAKTVVTKTYSLPRRHINRSLSPKVINFSPKVTAAKAPMVNAVKGVQGKWEWKPKCTILEHVSRNTTINRGYVAFGGNPKGGKISRKGKIKTGKLDFDDVYFVKELKFNLFSVSQMCDKKNNVLFTDTECLVLSPEFKLPDENQVLLRVPRENNMYNNRVLVTKPQNRTPYELLHGRTQSIGFMRPFGYHVTILNTLDPLGKFDGKVDEGFLVRYFNTDGDAAFEEKEPEFEGRKPESEVYVSSSSSSQSKKHDDKTKRKAKGKSPIKSLTGYRNLIPAVGQIFTNNTNTFSAAGPSDTAVSLTHGKYLYVDSSQLPDDPNMPKLEDITYSDDEEDVGAEANFTNLETTITEELLQFKMQKVWVLVDLPNGKRAIGYTQEEGIDYKEVFAPVVRIEAIRLFLAYASFMGFMVYQVDVKSAFLYETIEEEVYVYQPLGFKDLDYPDKVYKVVKELYGLHQAPRAWYETLANYLLENGFQRGKIDQTLFIKRKKGDILLVQIYVDDIIFGFTNKDLCKAFKNVMKDKF
nr:putative ribonuclease H-like domain-containing protein [Tanacetum cinerariifolium]